MDHLPLPLNSGPPERVPYLGYDYDNESFYSYHKRNAWTMTLSPDRKGQLLLLRGLEPEPVHITAFLQTWLYFGVLHEVFGERFNQHDFVHTDINGTKFLNTEHLASMFEECSEGLLSIVDVDNRALECVHFISKVNKVCATALSLATRITYCYPEQLSPWFLIALALLFEAMEFLTYDLESDEAFDHPAVKVPFDTGSSNLFESRHAWPSVDFSAYLCERMQQKGWCPRDTELLRVEASTAAEMLFRSYMAPRMLDRSHNLCDPSCCKAMTIDRRIFQLQHVNGCETCEVLKTQTSRLCALINDGQLPVIDICRSESSHVKLRVRARKPGEDFAAISHVWAEGLGNPFANALPTCQLVRLWNLLKDMHPTGRILPFWLDTLLVPLGPPDMYQKAMGQIRIPYQEAYATLVLDSYLGKLNFCGTSEYNRIAALACCNWTQRVWTLQEAMLSNNLMYLFADRAVSHWELTSWESQRYHPSVALARMIRSNIDMSAHRYSEPWLLQSLLHDVRESMKRRTLSIPDDEALCLGAVLGKDITIIATGERESRIDRFWQQFNEVPLEILFAVAPSKLNKPGLHWAPETFMG